MGVDTEIWIQGPDISTGRLYEINRRLQDLGIKTVDDEYNNSFSYHVGELAHFKTYWRYWGPGYERGPFHEISLVLNLATIMFPQSKVLYGGDNHYEEEKENMGLGVWTTERYIEYLKHLAGPDGTHYRDAF